MVDLDPGIKIKAESCGRGLPRSMISNEILGSSFRGSRSSKFAMRFNFGTAILI